MAATVSPRQGAYETLFEKSFQIIQPTVRRLASFEVHISVQKLGTFNQVSYLPMQGQAGRPHLG